MGESTEYSSSISGAEAESYTDDFQVAEYADRSREQNGVGYKSDGFDYTGCSRGETADRIECDKRNGD